MPELRVYDGEGYHSFTGPRAAPLEAQVRAWVEWQESPTAEADQILEFRGQYVDGASSCLQKAWIRADHIKSCALRGE